MARLPARARPQKRPKSKGILRTSMQVQHLYERKDRAFLNLVSAYVIAIASQLLWSGEVSLASACFVGSGFARFVLFTIAQFCDWPCLEIVEAQPETEGASMYTKTALPKIYGNHCRKAELQTKLLLATH
eukprot:566087-Amphidinium_carterae.1